MEHELYRRPRSGHGAQSEPARAFDAGRLVAAAGALTSVALIAGLALWGYRLAVRDVEGVPVVRALEGPARVAPADPGGELARHTGLAVNAVAAEGTAAAPPEAIALAPAPAELGPDARPMGALTEATIAPAPVASVADAATGALPAEVPLAALEAPAAALPRPVPAIPTPVALDPAAGFAAPPPEPLDEGSVTATLDAEPLVPVSVPGVVRSPRPPARPSGLGARVAALAAPSVDAPETRSDAEAVDPVAAAVAAAVAEAIAAPGPARELDPATLAPGTRLVQLGAFDDPETARAEWAAVEDRFGPLMAGKDRVIEATESGGRAFYRLRVAGFEDTADARRFCAALLAEGTACIPAQAR